MTGRRKSGTKGGQRPKYRFRFAFIRVHKVNAACGRESALGCSRFDCSACFQNTESGFTLLEIMLVIVIMAVTSMMVAPSYFSAISTSIDDVGKRLAQVLRLASEEATLSGAVFRVRFRQHSYQFQSADQEGVWQTLQKPPYQQYHLPKGFQIAEVKPSAPLSEKVGTEKKDSEAVLADLLLQPDGVGEMANIVLTAEPDDGHHLTVQLRPGPGGIVVKKDHGTP